MGWGDIFQGSLLAASHVLKLGAAQFHQKPASCPSDSNTPASHYWPTSYSAVVGLSRGAPSFNNFAKSQGNLTGVLPGPKLGILHIISEVKTLRALATASKSYLAAFEQNPKNMLSSILATVMKLGDNRSETSEDKNAWVESLPSRTHAKCPIKAEKGSLADTTLSDTDAINLDDLPEEKPAISTEDCLDIITAKEAAYNDKDHVKLNPEDEELLHDMQKDLKDKAITNAPHLKLSQTAFEAYYSDLEDIPATEDSTIITPDLADEVDEVPVSNPTSDHTDFAVDLDAASESSTSEGPAIITAVDLDIDSKNKPPSQEPANHTADPVVCHPLASSFAFGSGSLESPIKFSEELEKVIDYGSSSALVSKSDRGIWKPGETLVQPSVPDIESKFSTTSPFNFGIKSGFSFEISTLPTLPSSRGVEKATGPLPFVFRGKSVPEHSLGLPEMLIASSSPTTEITTRLPFQFGQNSTNDFKFGGPKVPTMPLALASTPRSLDTGIPKLAVSKEASMPNVISTRPRSTRFVDSSTTRPIATPRRRKVSAGADSGYGSGMSDKSTSPPPPLFVKRSSQPKVDSQTSGFLALRGVVATAVKDPVVEDVVDEYDEEISMLRSRIELEPAWDPAMPEDSDAMKRLKEKMAQEGQKELDEPKKEREERKKEQQEQLKAVIGTKEDSRKKKGGKKVKKGNNGEKDGPNTPVDKVTPAAVVTEKASPKEKTQKCKSKGRARFRRGKCGQGLVEPLTVTGTL